MPIPRRTRDVAAAKWASAIMGSRKIESGPNGTISSVNASPSASAPGNFVHQSSVIGRHTCSPDHNDS